MFSFRGFNFFFASTHPLLCFFHFLIKKKIKKNFVAFFFLLTWAPSFFKAFMIIGWIFFNSFCVVVVVIQTTSRKSTIHVLKTCRSSRVHCVFFFHSFFSSAKHSNFFKQIVCWVSFEAFIFY